jgi:hypothetical protein
LCVACPRVACAFPGPSLGPRPACPSPARLPPALRCLRRRKAAGVVGVLSNQTTTKRPPLDSRVLVGPVACDFIPPAAPAFNGRRGACTGALGPPVTGRGTFVGTRAWQFVGRGWGWWVGCGRRRPLAGSATPLSKHACWHGLNAPRRSENLGRGRAGRLSDVQSCVPGGAQGGGGSAATPGPFQGGCSAAAVRSVDNGGGGEDSPWRQRRVNGERRG